MILVAVAHLRVDVPPGETWDSTCERISKALEDAGLTWRGLFEEVFEENDREEGGSGDDPDSADVLR